MKLLRYDLRTRPLTSRDLSPVSPVTGYRVEITVDGTWTPIMTNLDVKTAGEVYVDALRRHPASVDVRIVRPDGRPL